MGRQIKKILKYVQNHEKLNDIKISIYNKLNFHKKGNNKDIFIFANARGGSTLIEGIIASQPGVSRIFEPLNRKRFYTKRTNIIPSYKYIYSSPARKEEFKNYFDKIFSNEITIHFPLAFWRDDFSLFPERYVFKFINCKELINYFEEIYDIQVIYFLRHPVPTILSRINWGWSDFNHRFEYLLNDEFFMESFPYDLACYAKEKFHKGNSLEQYAAGWCVENFLPLNKLNKERWLLMSYEKLITDPMNSLITLCQFLNTGEIDLMLKKIHKPSESVSAYKHIKHKFLINDNDVNREKELIKSWKKKISVDDEKRIFKILDKFEITCYKYDDFLPKF